MIRRSTKQRETVYNALMGLYHPTADQVYEKLSEELPTIGRATVFRNLAVLAEEGRIVKLLFHDEVARYDPNVDGHFHFICRDCERIIDIPAYQHIPLPKSNDFQADSTSVHFYGLCKECTQTEK